MAWLRKIWENRIEIVLFLSIVGAIFSSIGFFLAIIEKAPIWIIACGYWIFAFSLVGLNIYEMRQRRQAEVELKNIQNQLIESQQQVKELTEKISRFSPVMNNFHNIFHLLRNGTFSILTHRPEEKLYFREKTGRMTQNILTELVVIFQILYKETFSTCIKLFQYEDGKEVLKTFSRDSHSERSRNDEDGIKTYSVGKNTDFHLIIIGGRKWFYSPDLTKEGCHYENERTDWQKHYACTTVVPIQLAREKENDAKDNQRKVIGFLCIDSPRPNAYPEDESNNILACIADSLFVPLNYYRELSIKGDQNGR